MKERKVFFDTYNEMLNDMIDDLKREDIQKLFDLIEETRNNGKHLFVLGNGGNAVTVSHWVCDFSRGINRGDSKRLKIFSLADNGAIFSVLDNDCGYETTFVEQMKSFLEPGGLVPTFSVLGGSPNLAEAHRHAEKIGVKTAYVVADKGGKITGMSDLAMIIPSENYGVVKDIHVTLGHAISQQIYVDNVEA